jgi:hypothetical protein
MAGQSRTVRGRLYQLLASRGTDDPTDGVVWNCSHYPAS